MPATNLDPRDDFLQRLADSPRTIFWMTDASDAFLCLHQDGPAHAGDLRGLSLDNWVTLIHPEDRMQLGPLVQSAWTRHEGYKVRYRLRRSDGSWRWVLGTSEARFDADGGFVGFIGSVVDVSDPDFIFNSSRIDATHSLITENTSDFISHHAPDTGDYLYVAPAVRRLGYEPAELLGKSVYTLVHPDDVPIIRDEVLRQFRGQPGRVVEHRFLTKQGEEVWLSTSIVLLTDPINGQKLGAVVVARDISEQRRAREELRHSEERFRSLTNLSSDWYWETDASERFTFLSDGLYRLFGATPEEVLGCTRMERAADHSQPGLLEYQARVERREPFRDLVYSVFVPGKGLVRHSVISGEPVFENGVFKGYRGVGRDITHDIELSKELERLAKQDSLTGLPNRASLHEQLERMLETRNGAPVAVLFIDLDRFKEVNDSLGHVPGDMLLCEVANRLKGTLEPDELIARLGGDEFVVCAICPGGKNQAAEIARCLLDSLQKPVHVGGRDVMVRASIGISLAPGDGDTRHLLFQNADTAMYNAKDSGRNCYRFFEAGMTTKARVRLLLESGMHAALERGEFSLHYQPRFDLRRTAVVGMEALIRWHHPELGLVPPLEFIPFAEERGYIEAIGKWVLEEACRQTRRLSDFFGAPLQVSVNLSARQLRSARLVDDVAAALQASGLAGAQLELELTETALVEDTASSTKAFEALKALGVALAVDDFGTGYSGMGYLGQFPFDTLKLDRSFLARNDDASRRVIKAFIDMAHALDLAVVAEGVEEQRTVDFLREIGCDEVQGYFFARPLPLDELERFLAARKV
ncbi:EAL domain-containing protein [Oxalobacteraceae bacterium OM1]|nr:EAL domain-containing protein [Oxalobacteraceae bacterium OM1]